VAVRRLFALALRDAWTVLDLTVGDGGFWRDPLPPGIMLTTNDLDPAIKADLHLDYRATGLPEGFRDVVVYDPPHTSDNGKNGHFRDRYGGMAKGNAALVEDVVAGALEAWRLAEVAIVVKVIDASHGGEWVSLADAVKTAIPTRLYFELVTVRPKGIPDPKRRRHRVPENNGAIYLVFRKDSHRHRDFDTAYGRQEGSRLAAMR
jgi:hypothetical protein